MIFFISNHIIDNEQANCLLVVYLLQADAIFFSSVETIHMTKLFRECGKIAT